MREKSPLAGKTVKLKSTVGNWLHAKLADQLFEVEDWWQNVAGKSWMFCDGNPACLIYALRSGKEGLPTDDEVLYGKIGGLGHLIHISELALES